MARVWVAMSGGVDSSVAAALLVEAGHDVVGVTMQLWPAGDHEGGCCSTTAPYDAKRVCDVLGVPHYTLDFRQVFDERVVRPFCDAYAGGLTPNPCVLCNDRVKFDELVRRSRLDGAEALATGHYARVVRDSDGRPWLARGADRDKDQSYFLYRLTHEQLEHVRFPLGDLTKTEVREIARARGLPTAEAGESQEVCFAPRGDHLLLLRDRCTDGFERGPLLDTAGRVLGEHEGLARYTIGQRRGLPGGAPEPRYVVALVPERNAIVVGGEEDLAVRHLEVEDVVWRGEPHRRVGVQVRYRTREVSAEADVSGGRLSLLLSEDVTAAAPGQAVVCYSRDRVVGGGTLGEAR